MKHASRFLILFVAVMSGFVGIGFFKSFCQVFSIIDPSFDGIAISFLGGSFFLSSAIYTFSLAFKRTKGS